MGILFLAFTLVPFIELYLLVHLAQLMGFWSTVVLVLVTGSLGAALARAEGLRVLRGFRQSVQSGQVPEDGVISAVLVLVGGVLLVTPGVLTDAVGLMLLLPWTRRALAQVVAAQVEQRVREGHVRVVHSHTNMYSATGGRPGPGNLDGDGAEHTVARPDARNAARQGVWNDAAPRVIEVKSRVISSEPSSN